MKKLKLKVLKSFKPSKTPSNLNRSIDNFVIIENTHQVVFMDISSKVASPKVKKEIIYFFEFYYFVKNNS